MCALRWKDIHRFIRFIVINKDRPPNDGRYLKGFDHLIRL